MSRQEILYKDIAETWNGEGESPSKEVSAKDGHKNERKITKAVKHKLFGR